MNERTNTLIQRYLDDRDGLSDDELEQLTSALRESESLRGRLRDQLILDELLAQKHGVDRGNFPAQVEQRMRDQADQDNVDVQLNDMQALAAAEWEQWTQQGEGTTRRGGRRWTLVLSFALLAAVGAGLAYREYGPVATVDTIRGEMTVTRDGRTTLAQPGMRLYDQDRLQMVGAGNWSIRFADETRVSSRGAADVLLVGRRSQAKRVHVAGGDITSSVTPQFATQPMIFTTPNATATVLGTELFLWVKDDSTRLDVSHGRVRMDSRDKSAIVETDGFATAFQGELTEGERQWPLDPRAAVIARRFRKEHRDDLFNLRGDVEMEPMAYRLNGGAIMLDPSIAEDLVERCKKANACTIELWVRRGEKLQPKQARVFSLRSEQAVNAMLTLDEEAVMFQLNSSTPEQARRTPVRLGSWSEDSWKHLVLSFGQGKLNCYVDGHLFKTWVWGGDLSTWEPAYLAVGDDWFGDGGEAWSGRVGAVAMYARPLRAQEAYRHWRFLRDHHSTSSGE